MEWKILVIFNLVVVFLILEVFSGKVEKVVLIRKVIVRVMKNLWSLVVYVNLVNEIDVINLWYLRKKVVEDI